MIASGRFYMSNDGKGMLEQRIGLIGAGQMATALAHGFIKAGLTTADRLLASDVDEHARQRFAHAVAAHTTADNALVVAQSDVIILAVKPQQMAQVAAGLRARLPADADRLIVSIAAGIRLGLAGRVAWAGAADGPRHAEYTLPGGARRERL